MARIGPGTTLKLKATLRYAAGGTDLLRELQSESIDFGSEKLPELLWDALLGKKAGENVVLVPEKPFLLTDFLDHEVYRIEGKAFPTPLRVNDVVTVPVNEVDREMTVLVVEPDHVLVSANPLAMNSVKRADIQIVSLEGGTLIDADQIAPGGVLPGALTVAGPLAVNDAANTGANRGVWLWHATDPNHVLYSCNPSGQSPAGAKPAAGYFDGEHRFRLRTHYSQGFLFENSQEQAVVDITAREGHLWTRGGVYCGNSDLYFTKVDHNYTGIGEAVGVAAIENSSNYNALMILGRTVSTSPLRRVVKVWDELSVEGDFKALRTLSASDARDKHDIEDLDRGLEEVTRLRPVSFQWKQRGNATRTYGLIAQEVREVLPEVVDASADDSKLSVAYPELVPILINAVKELSARVATLEAQLASR